MFHPKMIMFFFEILVSKSKIDRVSSLCNNVCGLPAQVETILWGLNPVNNHMDSMEERLSTLEQEGGFGGQSASAKRKVDQKRKGGL